MVQFSIDLEPNGYQLLRTKQFAKDLLQGLSETPGVQSAAFAAFGLLEGGGWGMGITVDGYQPKPGDRQGSWLNAVSPRVLQDDGAPTGRRARVHRAR